MHKIFPLHLHFCQIYDVIAPTFYRYFKPIVHVIVDNPLSKKDVHLRLPRY